MLTILGSLVNMIEGGLYEHLMSTKIFTLVMTQNFHMSSEND
jgi:hypothetical protein